MTATGTPTSAVPHPAGPAPGVVPALTRPARALAVLSGAAGLVGGVALVGFFALAAPWRTGGYGPWAWLGPANDVLGAVFALALVPATVELAVRFRRDPLARWWSVAAGPALVALAAVSLLLVQGRVELSTQFAVTGAAMPVVVGWVALVSRRGERAGLVGWATARLGTASVVLVLAGAVLALPAFTLLRLGSPGQVALLVPGVVAWVALSAWPAVLGLASTRTAPDGLRRVLDAVVCRAYRLTGGRLGGRSHGAPVLLLTATGPGRELRTSPVAFVRDGAAFVVPVPDAALRGGPAWSGDVRADPDVRVELRRDVLLARAARLRGEEEGRARALLEASSPRLVATWGPAARAVPLVRLDPL